MNSQYAMQFPFTSREEILYWENCYINAQSERVMELERTIIGFKEKVLSRVCSETPWGYLLRNELSQMGKWVRAALPYWMDRNTRIQVKRGTAAAFSLDDDREKLKKLEDKICGVAQSVASVILHLYDRKKYPILSQPALRSVGISKEDARGPEYPFWQDYFNLCRVAAARYNVSMRTLDRALWQYSVSGNANRHS